ncbi:MAG: hypothetical protein ACFFER_14580 [Candidatus Thorarchaeota archaeon]
MNSERRNKPKDKLSLEEKLEYVRRLISNQYGLVHQSERYIFDIAKLASIVLAAISFIGIPQMLSFESGNMILVAISRGLAAGLIPYALVCVIVIGQAIWSGGGINLNIKSGIKPSLWWYSDSRLANLKARDSESAQKEFLKVHEEIQAEIEEKPDDMTFIDESITFSLLVLRTEHQLKTARRMKYILVAGLFFSFGIFLAGFFSILLV